MLGERVSLYLANGSLWRLYAVRDRLRSVLFIFFGRLLPLYREDKVMRVGGYVQDPFSYLGYFFGSVLAHLYRCLGNRVVQGRVPLGRHARGGGLYF